MHATADKETVYASANPLGGFELGNMADSGLHGSLADAKVDSSQIQHCVDCFESNGLTMVSLSRLCICPFACLPCWSSALQHSCGFRYVKGMAGQCVGHTLQFPSLAIQSHVQCGPREGTSGPRL